MFSNVQRIANPLFSQTLDSLRRIGARGGKAQALNRRVAWSRGISQKRGRFRRSANGVPGVALRASNVGYALAVTKQFG